MALFVPGYEYFGQFMNMNNLNGNCVFFRLMGMFWDDWMDIKQGNGSWVMDVDQYVWNQSIFEASVYMFWCWSEVFMVYWCFGGFVSDLFVFFGKRKCWRKGD